MDHPLPLFRLFVQRLLQLDTGFDSYTAVYYSQTILHLAKRYAQPGISNRDESKGAFLRILLCHRL